jgi:AcrR family transcriptional regulator
MESPIGLRERKRLQTRERLTSAAMSLFLERGFGETTLDEIARAAEVSRRTFFHYFASKEDLVFAWQDEMNADLIASVARQPAGLSPLDAAQNGIMTAVSRIAREDALALARLVHDSPALRARDQVKYEAMERALAAVLRERSGSERGDLDARLAATVAIGALRVASELWLEDGGREDPTAYAERAFAILRDQLHERSAR